MTLVIRLRHLLADLEVECFIELTNLSEKSKAKITSELVKIFEEVRSELDDSEPTKPPDTYVNLRQEVREIHELFLSKGWRITRVREKCIVLYIRSTSFASLASLFRECNKGEISAHLDGMRKELSSMEGAENVKVEFFIYKDEFLNVIDKTSKFPWQDIACYKHLSFTRYYSCLYNLSYLFFPRTSVILF